MHFFWKKKQVPKKDFKGQLWDIGNDVVFIYKNFLHLNVSKIVISTWSILLGILFFLPFFFLAFIVWFIDPIDWLEIVTFIFLGQDVSLELVAGLAGHPFWLATIMFLVFTAFAAFMLASSYSLFLLSRLAQWYIERKKLAVKENLYFSRNYITTFIVIFALNFVYILAPIIIWAWCIFFLYLFLNAWYIWNAWFELLSFLLAIIFSISILYLGYRLLFGYIILAATNDEKDIKKARYYVAESIRITSGKVFWKFLVVFIIYAIVIFPFYSLESILDRKLWDLSAAMSYKTQTLDNIDDAEVAYYEYITKEYSELSSEQISSRIGVFTWISVFYSILLYLLLSGLFVFVMTSFYTRILNK